MFEVIGMMSPEGQNALLWTAGLTVAYVLALLPGAIRICRG